MTSLERILVTSIAVELSASMSRRPALRQLLRLLAPRARRGPRRSAPRSPPRSRRSSASAGSAARSPPCAVASARCEASPISASCSLDRLGRPPRPAPRGSPRPARRRFRGSPRRSPRGHGSAAWLAASRTRTSASISSGPVSLDQLRRRAVGLADQRAERAQLLLGLGRALAHRREQGVERLALAGDARLALADRARRRRRPPPASATIWPTTASAESAVRSAWISIPASAGGISSRSWPGDLGQRRAELPAARPVSASDCASPGSISRCSAWRRSRAARRSIR